MWRQFYFCSLIGIRKSHTPPKNRAPLGFQVVSRTLKKEKTKNDVCAPYCGPYVSETIQKAELSGKHKKARQSFVNCAQDRCSSFLYFSKDMISFCRADEMTEVCRRVGLHRCSSNHRVVWISSFIVESHSDWFCETPFRCFKRQENIPELCLRFVRSEKKVHFKEFLYRESQTVQA